MNLITNLLLLAALVFIAFKDTNWKKPTNWLIVNVVELAAFGLLSVVMHNLYITVGGLCALGMVVDMFFFKKVPFKTNVLQYVRTFCLTVFFFPVIVFEEVYNSAHQLPPIV